MAIARAPKGLDEAGRRLWRQVHAAVAVDWELDERDLALLEQAARQADLIAKLEASIGSEGLIVRGAAGQDRLNAAVTALNVARGVLARLLAQVEIRPPQEKTGRMNRRQRNQARDRVAEQRRRQHGA